MRSTIERRLIPFLFLSSTLLWLSACSSINATLPMNRMENPEVIGKWTKLYGAAHYSGVRQLEFSPDASSRPPTVRDSALVNRYNSLDGKVGLGMGERFELNIRTDMGNAPWMFTAKYQLIGAPKAEAKVGNTSLSVTGGLGYGSQTKSGDQRGLFGPGGFKWRATLRTNAYDAAVIVGHRPAENTLLYGGPFITKYNFDGKIQQDRSDDGTSAGGDYAFTSEAQNVGAHAGLNYFFGSEQKALFTIELAYSQFTWKNSDTQRDGFLGLGLTLF